MGRKPKSGSDKPKPAAAGSGGKVENDSNKVGQQPPTQINEGQRTPDSRHDREAHIGSGNQTQSRRGDAKGH
jgi:hypothetical protein